MSDEQFALRFPFRPGHQVTGEKGPIAVDAGEIRLTLELSPPYVVLRAEPFPSEKAAAEFLPRLWAPSRGCRWTW